MYVWALLWQSGKEKTPANPKGFLLNTQKLPAKSKPKNTGRVLPGKKYLKSCTIHYKVTPKKTNPKSCHKRKINIILLLFRCSRLTVSLYCQTYWSGRQWSTCHELPKLSLKTESIAGWKIPRSPNTVGISQGSQLLVTKMFCKRE